ncbi:MAG: AAA family ATPase [Opitutaceae bacterium]|nr:AAA family ATPase [Opitutaceae bacterium]
MSSTRYASPGSPYRQERYAASEAFKINLSGVLVAKRCAVLTDDHELANLIWHIQDQSLPDPYQVGHRAGSITALARDLLAHAPGIDAATERVAIEYRHIEDWSRGETGFDDVELTADDLHRSYERLVEELSCALSDLSLDPQSNPVCMPGLGDDWRHALISHRKLCREVAMAKLAPTKITKRCVEALKFSRDTGRLSLITGKPRLGKSAAAKAFCAGSGGLARYVAVPEDNDMIALYRAFAKGLGVAESTSLKAAEIRDRVERMLMSSRLLLVLDEAQNLFSCSRRVTKIPQRVLWVRRLIDSGVPVVFVALPDFDRRIARCVEEMDWPAEQITDLICKRVTLPDRLSADDFELLASQLAPHLSITSRALIASEANNQQGAQFVVNILVVAKHIANKAGRPKVNDDDVREALGNRPSFDLAPSKKKKIGRLRTAPGPLPPESPAPAVSSRDQILPPDRTVTTPSGSRSRIGQVQRPYVGSATSQADLVDAQ